MGWAQSAWTPQVPLRQVPLRARASSRRKTVRSAARTCWHRSILAKPPASVRLLGRTCQAKMPPKAALPALAVLGTSCRKKKETLETEKDYNSKVQVQLWFCTALTHSALILKL